MIIPDTLPPVMAVFHKMQQVFVNLIINARHALNAKYMTVDDHKHIQIKVGVIEDEGHVWMRTTLMDNGGGIPPENMGRIFDPFFSTKPKGEGTGLGLSICYGIVRENGGHIKIESQTGAYTRVIVDLPLAASGCTVKQAAGENNG